MVGWRTFFVVCTFLSQKEFLASRQTLPHLLPAIWKFFFVNFRRRGNRKNAKSFFRSQIDCSRFFFDFLEPRGGIFLKIFFFYFKNGWNFILISVIKYLHKNLEFRHWNFFPVQHFSLLMAIANVTWMGMNLKNKETKKSNNWDKIAKDPFMLIWLFSMSLFMPISISWFSTSI
jgi:hypothetical protein